MRSPTLRPHWSYSAVQQYLRCPLQYYFERVLRLPRISTSSGLVFGSAVHEALATYHVGLRWNGDVSWDDVEKQFLDAWKLKEEGEVIQYKATESRDDLIAQGLELLKLYLQEPPPANIVAVEKSFLVPIVNSDGEILETPLLAIVDLLTQEDEVLKVNEFKTSGRSYGEQEVETSLQATCYANSIWEEFGVWPSVEYLVLVKTKSPKLQRMKTSRTEEDLGRLGDLIENVERAVKGGIFFPIENPLNCSGCSFREECREWKPERNGRRDLPELVELNGTAKC